MRAISGEKTGFAYADQISLLALEQSAQAARTIVRDSGDGKVQTLGAVEHSPLYTSVDPLQSMSREEKLEVHQWIALPLLPMWYFHCQTATSRE